MKVNSVTIIIDEFGHDAMIENRSGEVSKILRQLADRLDAGDGIVSNFDGLYLKDSNGNHVGDIAVDWDEDNEEE